MPKTKAAERAAIYVRLSRNRTGERSASTERQERECRALVDARGWEVAMVAVDDDVSAYSGRHRPGYAKVMDAVAVGAVDVVVAWAADRLHRRPEELETFIDAVESAGVEVATVQAGRVDLSTPSGRMHARMLGAVARYESEHRSARTTAAHDQIAAEGRWKGGRRPYGYQPQPGGTMTIIDDEAAVIAEVWERIVHGEAPGTVAADLNRRQIPTSTGSRWTLPTVTNMIRNPTLAGRRMHRGADVGPGQWPPILTLEQVHTAAAVLARRPGRAQPARVALLAGGRVTCSTCHTAMRTNRRNRNRRIYVCPNCFRSVAAEPLEEWIEELVVHRLDRTDLPVAADRTVPAGRTVEDLEGILIQLADAMGNQEITFPEWMAARKPIEAQLKDARARTDPAAHLGPVRDLTGPGVASARWPTLTLAERAAAVSALIEGIEIAPAIRKGPGFDDRRVTITWRESPA